MRNSKQKIWYIALIMVAPSILHLLVACATGKVGTVAPPPKIEGATFVGNQKCQSCHQSITDHFAGSVHARIHHSLAQTSAENSCESCHGPASLHVENGGGTPFQRFIVNPGKSADSCFKCHNDKRSEFNLPHHHPVLEGQMNCVDCHDPHGADIFQPSFTMHLSGADAACTKCHKEQTQHFVFEHEAMREGCISCHQPHGSINDKLLIQRDANLCLKCHAQEPDPSGQIRIGMIDHSYFLREGTCISCHTAVHGSHVDPKLRY
ncbi:MAG: cytochrome c3 family protein [Lentimonas sp.]